MNNCARTYFFLFVLLFSLTFSAWGADSGLQKRVNDLAGSDDPSRVVARQMLPVAGVEAIPFLIPLLSHAKPEIQKAAQDVLFDIANEACAPGRDSQRVKVVDAFIPLLASSQPKALRVVGLNLLAITVPAGYNLRPIAELLKDVDLRDKVRTTLEKIATPEACAALREALKDAEPPFKCALLHSLGQLQDAQSVETIKTCLQDSRFEVLMAALDALIWSGDPSYLDIIGKMPLPKNLTPDQDAEMKRVMARYLETMMQKGHADHVLPILNSITDSDNITNNKPDPMQLVAIAALGKIGDENQVPKLLWVIQKGSRRVRGSAVNALKIMGDAKVTERLLAEYPKQPPETQSALLSVLGARKDARALPLLAQSVESQDSAFRMAAYPALAEMGLPEGLDILLNALQKSAPETEKSLAAKSLFTLAETLQKRGVKEPAGKAFVRLYTLADDAALREQAAAALAYGPVPEAYAVAKTVADSTAGQDQKISLLIATSGALRKSNQPDKALELFQKLISLKPKLETVTAIADQLKYSGVDIDVAGVQGFVTQWRVVGPFSLSDKKDWNKNIVGEPEINLKDSYPSGDKKMAWKPISTHDPIGKVDLIALLGSCEQCVAYAYAEVVVNEEMKAEFRLGVDDGEQIWVNGEKVFDNFTARPFQLDQDRVPVKLKAGTNKILLKIYQNNLGWEFNLRITTTGGDLAPFVQN